MKLLVGVDIGSYVFDPGAPGVGTVTINGINDNLNLEQILIITDVSINKILYNFSDPSCGGSIFNNIITLNTDMSLCNPNDRLQIWIDYQIEPIDSLPISVTPSLTGQRTINQAMPVALANEQFYDYQGPISSLLSPIVGTVLLTQDCLQYRSVALQITTGAGISAGVVSFEGSNDLDAATNWAAITLIDTTAATPAGATSLTLAASTNKFFTGPIEFRYFRVRVSTTVAGGLVSCLPIFRIAPFSPFIYTGYQGINTAQYGGTNVVIGGVAGVPSVGGNIAPGSAATAYPVTMGGVDYGGLVRRFLTDSQGHQLAVGPDPTRVLGTNPVNVVDVGERAGKYQQNEIFEMILNELRLQSYYLKELPYILSLPNGSFKEELKDIIDNIDKNI